ncbi:MAG: hypothetical protein HKP13_10685 [Gammaproteobacteria bacterium]|nr:hypothetical protein [Gammaproteobacteria bacterium]
MVFRDKWFFGVGDGLEFVTGGKHLLNWIFGSQGIHDEVRFHLAYITRAEGKIDLELTGLIEMVKSGAKPRG